MIIPTTAADGTAHVLATHGTQSKTDDTTPQWLSDAASRWFDNNREHNYGFYQPMLAESDEMKPVTPADVPKEKEEL